MAAGSYYILEWSRHQLLWQPRQVRINFSEHSVVRSGKLNIWWRHWGLRESLSYVLVVKVTQEAISEKDWVSTSNLSQLKALRCWFLRGTVTELPGLASGNWEMQFCWILLHSTQLLGGEWTRVVHSSSEIQIISFLSLCLYGTRAPIIDSFFAWKPLIMPQHTRHMPLVGDILLALRCVYN